MSKVQRARDRRAAAQRAEAERRSRLRRNLWLAFAVVLAAVAMVAVGLATLIGQDDEGEPGAVRGVQTFQGLDRGHVQTRVDYAQTPPVGGDHFPVWQNCGFYDAPVPSGTGVHSLEHGALWITYRPGLPADQVAALRSLAGSQSFVLASPLRDLPAPVVASAWGVQLPLDDADDPRLDEFVRAYRMGPQTPEPGAPCTGGFGRPAA